MRKALTYIEIDQPYCSRTYGTAPCTAAVGVTGAAKCFNTRKTCQDPANFDNEGATLRFAVDVAYLPSGIEAIASIVNWSVSPSIISLGENLGLRAEMRVTLKDHPWSDTGPGGDKYRADRSYDAFSLGTYWGKWRARVQFLRGQNIRLINGYLGQALDEMEVRHFVVETVDGPQPDGTVTIICKDPLKLLDGDRAQAPVASRGFLIADVLADSTELTVAPAGIGVEYPASGYIAIGGSEICEFTRAGDVFTLVERAQFGTEAEAHSSEDRVQICLHYQAADPANIISDLMQTYAGMPSGFVPLGKWLGETENKLRRVYTALIPEPTPVKALVSEIIEQAALAVWWDEVLQEIQLRVLSAIALDANVIDPDLILQGSLRQREQPDRRISQVWVYYGQKNPLRKLDEADNYRSIFKDVDFEAEANYGSPAIKKIFSRWIPAFGRVVASRLATIQLGRFRNPPRRFNFDLLRDSFPVSAGQGYRLAFWNLQDETGTPTSVPIQATRFQPDAAEVSIEAEEFDFIQLDPEDLENRVIIIDAATLDFNLRSAHDNLYPPPETPGDGEELNLLCIIESGVTVGSRTTAAAFNVGDWPAGIDITIINKGRIAGRGGDGGSGFDLGRVAENGDPGGLALYARYAVALNNTDGVIAGGGGGGGGGGVGLYETPGAGGGGGAGFQFGIGGVYTDGSTPANNGKNGTILAGGAGGTTPWFANGGAGGNPASVGGNGAGVGPGAGGAAGGAIDGDSYITFAGEGSILGTRIG